MSNKILLSKEEPPTLIIEMDIDGEVGIIHDNDFDDLMNKEMDKFAGKTIKVTFEVQA